MSDPIALIQDILSSFATPSTNATSTASTETSDPDSGSTTAATSSSPDYTLSDSLSSILSKGTSTGLTGNALATYNGQALKAQSQSSVLSALPSDTTGQSDLFNQISLYQQYVTTARADASKAAQSTSTSSNGTLDSVLSVAKTTTDA
jgi:hypothetical protein